MIKKLSNFIVNKRIVILVTMLILAVVSIICSRFVTINEDMTKYLPDDSNMKAGLAIMEEEFPEMDTSNSIRVMFDDLTDEQKETVLEELSAIPNVDSVDYDAESSDHNKANHTLFVLNMSCDYGSDEEAAIESALKSQFSDYTMVWKNNDSGFPDLPIMLIVVALAILLVILFIMCDSWIEPLLFLVVIGVAVVINGGTNIILGSVASITNSISAILQLVLSMDYSIILMNRYRQEKALEPDRKQAMKNALASSFSSIASSALTTVIGLVMLVFMSFKIGANLGIVLAKGVFISMVCVLMMLPGIILACDKPIQKTAKKSLHIPMGWAAKYSFKARNVLACVFVALFVGSFILQQHTGIAYTLTETDEIADVFPTSNTVVMVYENKDEDKINDLITELEKDENVKSVLGYNTVLGKHYTSGELTTVLSSMSGEISLGSGVIDMLYYDYYSEKSDNAEPYAMTLYEFVDFIQNKVATDPTFSSYLDENMLGQIQTLAPYTNKEAVQAPRSANELSTMLGMNVDTIFSLKFNGDVADKTMSLEETVDFILATDTIKNQMTDEMLGQLQMAQSVIDVSVSETEFVSTTLAGMLGMEDSSMLDLMYLYAESSEKADPTWTMTLETLFDYMMEDVLSDPRFESVINADMRQMLIGAQATLAEGKSQLVSDNHSRLIITTAYPEEGETTTAFFADLEQFGNDELNGEFSLVGNAAMNYEMQKTFDNELLLITLLTALAIFIIISLTFKSLTIPLILVLLVQCGVYITIAITGALNGSIYYLALLIVECILMGSTVDYGILFTNYYCEARKTANVKDALKSAYAGSIHTIMTSGLILILVTAVVGGMFNNPTVSAIVRTISMGALCATLLILFVLPGILAACDKIVTKKRDRYQ